MVKMRNMQAIISPPENSSGSAVMSLPRKLPLLDGLRGLAALIVLVSHGANAGFLPEMLGAGLGRTGVGVFYALSGFLMAHVCLDKPLNRATLRTYGVARGSRVLPLYYAVILVDLALWALVGRDYYSIESARDVALNLLLLRGDRVLWSVPVEVQFYVLFVGLWWLHDRGWLRTALLLLAPLCAAMALIAALGLLPIRDTILPVWLHFFLIGIAMRQVIARHYAALVEFLRSRAGVMLGLAALAGLLLLPPALRALLGHPALPAYADPLVLVLVPVLLALCVAGHRLFAWLAHPVMRWFGQVSFSLYLLHWPVVQLAEEHDLGALVTPLGAFAVVSAVSIAAAALSYRLIERPAQERLRRLASG